MNEWNERKQIHKQYKTKPQTSSEQTNLRKVKAKV